ncbi:DUF4397 domain-containing protein [Shewanella mesophila]|uniref:DUF4397 domain-containing protein n=1 Tax=Shewanella mesophila TaxID=2864208 RepID=UPI001C65E656|nr:DUF4397 domain-containing protein [Shewanella mesophila]QYJ85903.1 DUF4397 domain-containing protein [Shewanella mesophila]
MALLVALNEAHLVVLDKMASSDVRVVHGVANAPAVDVFLDGAATPAVDMLAFGDVTGYLNVPESDHTVTVAADASNNVIVIDEAPVTLTAGQSYSVLGVGSLGDDAIQPWGLMENRRAVVTKAKLNVAHASYSAGNVDIYLTPSGTKTVAIGPLNVGLAAGGLYGVATVDGQGGGAPLGVILTDDFIANM